jgi:hypothetical protein
MVLEITPVLCSSIGYYDVTPHYGEPAEKQC